MGINYAIDITSPVNDILMIYGSHYQTQSYTYGVDRISMDMWEIEDHDNGWIPNGTGTNLSKDADGVYYLEDELNNTIKVIGENGKTSAHYNYDEFGRPESERKFDQNWTGPDNTFGYTGYQYDVYAGLWYAQARYYDPQVGRFFSEDSYKGDIIDPLSLNLYTYVNNNPVNMVDPTGHWPDWLDKIMGWGKYSKDKSKNSTPDGITGAAPGIKPLADKNNNCPEEMGNGELTEEQKLLIATVYGEAANCSEASWEAVANVIMNRVGTREWKNMAQSQK